MTRYSVFECAMEFYGIHVAIAVWNCEGDGRLQYDILYAAHCAMYPLGR